MMPKTLLLFLCVLFSQMVFAQFNETDFEHYTVSNGLSDNNVNSIAQDELGYIWIGTEVGLNRFNGENFTHFFSRSKPFNLAASYIVKLIPFSNSRIGVISRQGFQVINTKTFTAENYRFPDTSFFSSYNNGVFDAIELPDKSILFSSMTGIYAFDKPDHLCFRYDNYTSTIAPNKAVIYGQDIIAVNNKEAIIYTDGYKMDSYDFEKRSLQHIEPLSKWQPFYPEQTHGTSCTKIAEDQFIIFNRYADSLTFFDQARNIRITSKPSCLANKELDWESKVFVIDDSSFAMNDPVTGYFLFHMNKKTGIITADAQKYLPSYKCNYLFVDKEKHLWVGTRTGLLHQKTRSVFLRSSFLLNSKKTVSNERFTSVLRYKDKIYVGSFNRYDGLCIADTATMKIIKRVPFYGVDNGWCEINSIQCYHKDTLWIGTTKGLLWMDIHSFHYGVVKDNRGDTVLPGSEPVVCPVDKNGKAWLFDFMNGEAGFYDTSKRTFTFFTLHTDPALPFGRIKHIVYDAYGDVWLAGHGLARWNNAKQAFDTMMNVYAGPNKFKDDILAIAADNKGSLWFYNAENVLLEYKIKEKKFYEHGADKGLPPFLQSIADNINDKLWFTTGSQLICYDPSQKKVIYFDQDDSLPVERASSRTIYYDRERNYFYSLHNNYLVAFPADIPQTHQKEKQLLISEIEFPDSVFYNPSGTLHLNYTQQNFSIHFNVLNYDQPKGYNFYYSVNNTNWINLDGHQVIFFSQLPSGTNHIKIKAVSKLGNQLLTEIVLKVSRPFWETWWFIALVCVVVFAIFYSIYKYRINQIIKLQTMRNDIARDLHDDIGSTIGSINLYSQVAYGKMQNQQPLAAEEILQKIGAAARQMTERMGDIVWSINSKNDYLENLVDRMKSFCAMELTSNAVDFNFYVNDTFKGTKLSMDKRKNIFLIFKEAVHNSLKYAECKKINISIIADQNFISMIIKDDGKGFDIKNNTAHNGNGLRNMRERASSVNGALHIFSTVNEGTTVELKVEI